MLHYLRREAKVHKLRVLSDAKFFELLLEEVLNGLDVMVRYRLCSLNGSGICLAEVGEQRAERLTMLLGSESLAGLRHECASLK